MARSVAGFYGDHEPALPIGLAGADDDASAMATDHQRAQLPSRPHRRHPVTGTPGPALTHLPLTAGVGLTRYDESYADITGLQPVARWRLVRRRGLLTQGELGHIENGVRTYLGL